MDRRGEAASAALSRLRYDLLPRLGRDHGDLVLYVEKPVGPHGIRACSEFLRQESCSRSAVCRFSHEMSLACFNCKPGWRSAASTNELERIAYSQIPVIHAGRRQGKVPFDFYNRLRFVVLEDTGALSGTVVWDSDVRESWQEFLVAVEASGGGCRGTSDLGDAAQPARSASWLGQIFALRPVLYGLLEWLDDLRALVVLGAVSPDIHTELADAGIWKLAWQRTFLNFQAAPSFRETFSGLESLPIPLRRPAGDNAFPQSNYTVTESVPHVEPETGGLGPEAPDGTSLTAEEVRAKRLAALGLGDTEPASATSALANPAPPPPPPAAEETRGRDGPLKFETPGCEITKSGYTS